MCICLAAILSLPPPQGEVMGPEGGVWDDLTPTFRVFGPAAPGNSAVSGQPLADFIVDSMVGVFFF